MRLLEYRFDLNGRSMNAKERSFDGFSEMELEWERVKSREREKVPMKNGTKGHNSSPFGNEIQFCFLFKSCYQSLCSFYHLHTSNPLRMTTSSQTEHERSISWSLSLYLTEPTSLPFLNSNPTLSKSIIFVGGLTDAPGTVPYIPSLVRTLHSIGWSLIMPTLSSSLGGYGQASLEGDAQEIQLLLCHLKKQQVILMGHSTGCQDLMTYLSKDRPQKVKGVILQAPVSDRDDFNCRNPDGSEELELATKLVKEGKGHQLLPRDISSDSENGSEDLKGNTNLIINPAFTAYRYHSLFSKNGDDDFFSNDLSDEELKERFEPILKRGKVLALLGEDE